MSFALCLLHFAFCTAGESATDPATRARLFFSDAKISFAFPEGWTLEPSFPSGPLFSKATQEGSQAYMTCQISGPTDPSHLASDLPEETLRKVAIQDLSMHQPNARVLAKSDRSIAAHNAYEVTWEDRDKDRPQQHQSVYFFTENRVYSVSLQAKAESFPWIVPDFQQWLTTFQVLTNRDSGALAQPSRGGLWIHQTAGAKIALPENWLIGVASDHLLGATVVESKMHSEITVTVDTGPNPPGELTATDRAEARRTIEKKGLRILTQSDEPFHGLPAYLLTYDGTTGGRYVKGEDIWVVSPKARWLLNIEGDGPLFNRLTLEYHDILNNIQFL